MCRAKGSNNILVAPLGQFLGSPLHHGKNILTNLVTSGVFFKKSQVSWLCAQLAGRTEGSVWLEHPVPQPWLATKFFTVALLLTKQGLKGQQQFCHSWIPYHVQRAL